jgi:hypothetical protein
MLAAGTVLAPHEIPLPLFLRAGRTGRMAVRTMSSVTEDVSREMGVKGTDMPPVQRRSDANQ